MEIGPYAFSDEDVRTTLAAGWDLFDELELRLPEPGLAIVAPHRAAAEVLLDDVLHERTTAEVGLEQFWSTWREAMAELRAAGVVGGRGGGVASGLFTSDGGVPKHPQEAVEVDFGGVVGDRQGNRTHHGRPFQALCLWSVEVIEAFQADGHPIAPGLAGENVTIAGLPWELVRPGAVLRIGEVLAEASAYAVPCRHNARWFAGGRFGVMHHRHGPVSRVYATVLEPGRIAVGDPVTLAAPA